MAAAVDSTSSQYIAHHHMRKSLDRIRHRLEHCMAAGSASELETHLRLSETWVSVFVHNQYDADRALCWLFRHNTSALQHYHQTPSSSPASILQPLPNAMLLA
eukprot:GHUV01047102.1.p1 GENE.GHUV01047102.1~~GHUV01047102.1.p1  ORF type:complete len:103 (-),score=15.64 GHUV01047102.1:303-611(-)